MRDKTVLMALLLAGLLIAGCSLVGGGAPAESVTPPTETPQPAQDDGQNTTDPTDEPTATETSSSETEAQAAATEPVESEPAPLPDQGSIPTGSSALKATDPSTVNLADGDPTLVEFFAFW